MIIRRASLQITQQQETRLAQKKSSINAIESQPAEKPTPTSIHALIGIIDHETKDPLTYMAHLT